MRERGREGESPHQLCLSIIVVADRLSQPIAGGIVIDLLANTFCNGPVLFTAKFSVVFTRLCCRLARLKETRKALLIRWVFALIPGSISIPSRFVLSLSLSLVFHRGFFIKKNWFLLSFPGLFFLAACIHSLVLSLHSVLLQRM